MVINVRSSKYHELIRDIKNMGYRVKHDGEIVKEERDSLSWLLGSYDKKIGEIHMTSNCRYYIVSGTIEAELKDDYDRDNRRT